MPVPRRRFLLLVPLVALAGAAPGASEAVVVDGHLDPAYGAPIVVQTNLTAAMDPNASNAGSLGWQLDAAYGFVSADMLYLMFTGNMLAAPNNIEPGTESSPLNLFIDCAPGGQNVVRSLSYPLDRLAGLTFDPPFSPEFYLGAAAGGGPDFGVPYRFDLFEARLASESNATTSYAGGITFGSVGPLSGGSNPDAVEAAIDNSNRGGLGQGCGAGTPGPVSTGFEFAIPLAALGHPIGPIRVCALISWGSATNQVLSPVPAGICGFGAASTVNFADLAGDQFFTVSLTTAVPPPLARGMYLAPRANPDRGLGIVFEAAPGTPARIQVMDVTGRRVLDWVIASPAAGRQALTLAAPGTLASGLYLVRLQQGDRMLTTRSTVVR